MLVGLPLGWLAFTHKGAAGRAFDVAAVVFYVGFFAWILLPVLALVVSVTLAIGRWFKNMSSLPNAGDHYAGPRKSCQVCGGEASYEIRLESWGDATPLCASHAHALERVAEHEAWMSASRSGLVQREILRVEKTLAGAETDLREAAVIAPRLDGVQESLRQLGELRLRMDLPPRR